MNVPTNLTHHPVISINNYDEVDGAYEFDSNAKCLSLGLAQWNEACRASDISAKIWRHTGTKWSRQSEEMPLNRVLDLAIMIVKARHYFDQPHISGYKEQNVIDRIELQKSTITIRVCVDNDYIDKDYCTFRDRLCNDKDIDERLRYLARILHTVSRCESSGISKGM